MDPNTLSTTLPCPHEEKPLEFPFTITIQDTKFTIPESILKSFPTPLTPSQIINHCPKTFKYVIRYLLYGTKIDIIKLSNKLCCSVQNAKSLVDYWNIDGIYEEDLLDKILPAIMLTLLFSPGLQFIFTPLSLCNLVILILGGFNQKLLNDIVTGKLKTPEMIPIICSFSAMIMGSFWIMMTTTVFYGVLQIPIIFAGIGSIMYIAEKK